MKKTMTLVLAAAVAAIVACGADAAVWTTGKVERLVGGQYAAQLRQPGDGLRAGDLRLTAIRCVFETKAGAGSCVATFQYRHAERAHEAIAFQVVGTSVAWSADHMFGCTLIPSGKPVRCR